MTSLAMMLAVVVGMGPAASAATNGITSSVLLNGSSYDGTQVVNEGDTITLRVQYTEAVGAGAVVTFDLGSNVTLTGVPAGNTAVESFVQDGNKVTVTFKDPWPSGVNQGVFDLKFTVNNVDASARTKLTWTIDGDENSVDVIVRNNGDEFANVKDDQAKAVSPTNLNKYVSVTNGTVSLDPAVTSQDLSYTLTLYSAEARSGFAVEDQMPAGLAYVADSFDSTITTWDADGLNKQTGPFTFAPEVTGNSFVGAVDVPGSSARDPQGPSVLKVTYRARVTDTAALRDALQAEYDKLGGKPGSYSVSLTNTATFGGATKTATITAGGTVAAPPGPTPGSAFGKSGSWKDQTVPNSAAAADGTLTPPLDITYTLTAKLGSLKGQSDFVLSRNVVISDTLPAQAVWASGDSAFVTATGIALTKSPAGTDCTATNFAGDAYVGQYCVDGATLLINVGQDTATSATISVKAQITTVDGLADGGTPSLDGATKYKIRNSAGFTYDDGKTYPAGYDSFITVLPDKGEQGYHDPSAFSKTAPSKMITVAPGDSATVPYTFTVAAGTDYDVTASRIVDYVDSSLFDLGDPSAVDVSGTYDGQSLGAGDFALSTDTAGNLVIALSDAGKAVARDRASLNKKWVVTIKLTTKPFDGKQTKTLKNSATLFGAGDDPLYWDDATGEATSYGDEAEVRKRLYDRQSGEWTDTLKAYTDVNGSLVQDTYVYRVEFIPHGSYDSVVIADVNDLLPDSVEFLGFVTEANAATAADPQPGPVDIGGNLEATYHADDKTVTLSQQGGTVLKAGEPIAAYFAVKILNHEAPIVNRIGSTEATIVPQAPPSIDIEKWTDEGASSGPAYDDSGALTNDGYPGDFDNAPGKSLTDGADQLINFTISNDGGEALANVTVSDRTTDGTSGTITNLQCTFPDGSTGTTWDGPFEPGAQFPCTGTLPGLSAGQSHSDTATVAGTGVVSGDAVTDSDSWNGYVKSYAVGDYVWVDSNRDGIQGPGEPVLAGVTVELLDGDGNVVATTTTDADGRYLFDNVPAGTYRVKFTLTKEQSAKYRFTSPGAGASDGADSDADPATGLTRTFVLDDSNAALTHDYDRDVAATQGIDPTWDAGVIVKSVSVGDYVWVDSNRDGIQDPGEPGIEGVTMCLVGPDGNPVTDVYGNPVKPVVTDKDGRYSFDNLPVLSGDQTYTVCIDKDTSAEVLKPYVPTKDGAGSDRAKDSSTWQASTQPGDLHEDGMRDPTLDFGFVTKSYAVGDYVWIDSNRDGIQSPGEPVLPGVTVELLDGDGNVVATTTTDADGRYLFDNVPAGTYRVKFTLTKEQSAKYRFTSPGAGASDGADSDADPATGLTRTFVLDDSNAALTHDYDRDVAATQGIDPTWDAGVILRSSDETGSTETGSTETGSTETGPTETGPTGQTGSSGPTGQTEPTSETTAIAPTSGNLPYTGVRYGSGAVAMAVLLLLAGGALLVMGRRRRKSSH